MIMTLMFVVIYVAIVVTAITSMSTLYKKMFRNDKK